MKIAMSRPTAREAWQDAVVEYQQGETLSRRLAAAEWSRIEAEKINAAIRGAPPLEETEWQPPSPNRVVGARGKNDSEIRERWRQRLDEEINKEVSQKAMEAKEKHMREVAELKAAQTAEEEWWEWYKKAKAETEAEALRRAEEERIAEEIAAKNREEARYAKMDAMRKEEAERRARAKAEAEKVEKINAAQRAEAAAIEEAQKRAKAEAARAARKAKSEAK